MCVWRTVIIIHSIHATPDVCVVMIIDDAAAAPAPPISPSLSLALGQLKPRTAPQRLEFAQMTEAKQQERLVNRIRAVQKVGGNRECLDCTEKGPQAIVLNFSTFVCTVCSGIHREFNHRIKGISMSKFTSEEVAEMEAKGNDKMHAVCVCKCRVLPACS